MGPEGGGESVQLLARWWQHLGHLLTFEVRANLNQQCDGGRGDQARTRIDYESVCSIHGTCISTRVTLLLLERDGEEGATSLPLLEDGGEGGATHTPDDGDLSHHHQLCLGGLLGGEEPRQHRS